MPRKAPIMTTTATLPRDTSITDLIITIPLADSVRRVHFGSVQTVEYRDSVHGVRFTVHMDPRDLTWWIVRHAPAERADTDGTPVARSPRGCREDVAEWWAAIRESDTI
jgi:hypothetical protein